MGLLKVGAVQYRFSAAAIPASTSKAYRLRPYSQTATASSSLNPLSAAFYNVMKRYEDFIGITDVKEAQRRVMKVHLLNSFALFQVLFL